MMDVKINVTLDRGAIERMTRSPGGLVGMAIRRAGAVTVQRAQRSAPVRSGAYRRSITVEPVAAGSTGPTCVIVAGVEYAQSIEFKQRPVLGQALDALRTSDFT